MSFTIPIPFLWFLFDTLTSLPVWVIWYLHTENLHWSRRYVLFPLLYYVAETGAEMAAGKWG